MLGGGVGGCSKGSRLGMTHSDGWAQLVQCTKVARVVLIGAVQDNSWGYSARCLTQQWLGIQVWAPQWLWAHQLNRAYTWL